MLIGRPTHAVLDSPLPPRRKPRFGFEARPTRIGLCFLCCLLWAWLYACYFGAVLLWRSECRPWPFLSPTVAINKCLGVHERRAEYGGPVAIESALDVDATLSFQASDSARQLFLEATGGRLQARGRYDLDAAPSGDFDFRLVVKLAAAEGELPQELVATVVRNATYRLVGFPLALQEVTPPPRRRSERLAAAPAGLSFGFSASGWLLAYQFGAAECLQNHGITRNPFVRLAGTSGGALSLWTMMYGCDMKALKDFMKESASKVYQDLTQSMNLRTFVLDAMRTVLRDCSFRHPTFLQHRVEIVMSEASGVLSVLFGRSLRSRRVSQFNESADVAIALLASSSIGISGLPFAWAGEPQPADGVSPLVADGAFTDFLPEVDRWTVKLKPFSDGLNVWGKRPPEVAPTEFVPLSYGLWPPDGATMDHLFELGYRDMEAWLDQHLEAHLAQLPRDGRAEPVLPVPPAPGGFRCSPEDGGMQWYEKVRSVVPVTWHEQLFSGPVSPRAGAGSGA